MIQRILHLLAVLALVLGSGVSAARMAPEREAPMRMAAVMAVGSIDADFCGDPAHHDHHCPFCHGQAGADAVRPDPAPWRLLAVDAGAGQAQRPRAAHLHRGARPRAPPSLV